MIFDMKSLTLVKNLSSILILAISLLALTVYAMPQRASALPANCQKSFLTIPAWYNYLPESPEGNCEPSLGEGNEEEQVNTTLVIGITVLEGILRASTFVALAMIFFGAFKFITTQGNAENATKARQTVINASIGFAIVLVASQAVAYVARTLGG